MSNITFEKLFRGGYRAMLGQFSETGATKKAAETALLGLFASMPSDMEPIILAHASTNWVLWFEGRSWMYRIGDRGAVCICSGSRSDALQAMRRHMAEYYTVRTTIEVPTPTDAELLAEHDRRAV